MPPVDQPTATGISQAPAVAQTAAPASGLVPAVEAVAVPVAQAVAAGLEAQPGQAMQLSGEFVALLADAVAKHLAGQSIGTVVSAEGAALLDRLVKFEQENTGTVDGWIATFAHKIFGA